MSIILTEEQKDQIIYNYTVLKQGLATAGKQFHYSQYMVEKLLKERGIQKRTYVESKQVLRKYHVDDDFFKHQSPDMAYILGFIAADGSIAKDENGIFIEIHQKDAELLKQIAKIVKSDRPLNYRVNNQGTPCVKMKVWSAAWKQDLAVYGITPNKTFTLKPPSFLSQEYHMDYIRGYFDGDGSVWKRTTINRTTIGFVSATKEILDWIRNEFNKYGVSTVQNYSAIDKQGTRIYYLRYDGQQKINIIKHLLYDSTSNLFLTRKKEIFD